MSQNNDAVENLNQTAAADSQPGVETQQADDTASQNAPTDKQNDQQDGEGINYKAELERVTAERDNYKAGLINTKRELKKVKQEAPDDDPAEQQYDPQAVSELASIVADQVKQELATQSATDFLEAQIASMTDNPDKQKLIRFYYENKIVKSGLSRQAILADLQDALVLSDKQRMLKENQELKVALSNRKNPGNSGYGNNQALGSDSVEPKLSDADRRLLDRFGVDPKTVPSN